MPEKPHIYATQTAIEFADEPHPQASRTNGCRGLRARPRAGPGIVERRGRREPLPARTAGRRQEPRRPTAQTGVPRRPRVRVSDEPLQYTRRNLRSGVYLQAQGLRHLRTSDRRLSALGRHRLPRRNLEGRSLDSERAAHRVE